MPLSAFISRPWQPRNVFSQRLATTRGSLPNELKPKPLPHTSYYSKTTINESPVNVTPTTVERSEKARLSVRPSSESCVAETPTNSPRDTLGDDGKGTLVADELEERLARIAAQAERNPKQSTHQQSFTRASRNLRPGDDYDTYDRSLEDPTSPRVARATSLICGLPCHPCPGGNSDTRDTQYDTDTETAVESDDDCETAIGSDSDNYISVEDTDSDLEDDIGSDEDLYQPLLEILYRSYSDDQREKLMKAIFVDQLVTKARIDPRRDLKGLCGSGYARELAEGIGKQLALKVDGLSTTAILDTALNRQQEWSRPLSSIEQSIILQEDLDQANKALRECQQHHLGILSCFYLLRLLAQLDVVPDFHSFPASSEDVQLALTSVLRGCTVKTTAADIVTLDPKLLMAAALHHRARINAKQSLGYSIDAKICHDFFNLRARRPDLRLRWLIGETERLTGSHAPPSLGDAERLEQCRNTLKLQPFALLRTRYGDVKVRFTHEQAIEALQHEPHFQTDFVARGHDRGVYLYYCTLVLASYGFEPPLDLDIELDSLVELILREMERRDMVKLCLMGRCLLK